jgi:hypothetical protein
MKYFMRAFVVFAWFASSQMVFCRPIANAEQGENFVAFHWAFGAKVMVENDQKFISIHHDTTLRSGDRFKMFVELQKDCFVYLIYHSSQDSLHMLFPYDFQQFDPKSQILKKHYIPQSKSWFVLDQNVGLETIYLLGSTRRLKKLEALFIQYESTKPAQKTEIKERILAEIRELRWQYRKFKKGAERPVATMGHLRGSQKVSPAKNLDVADHAVEISAQEFYSRTFTIDHR